MASSTNHVLFMMGNDFTFQNGALQFKVTDVLIETINEMKLGVKASYSSLEKYYNSVMAYTEEHEI